jgi:ABC-type Zn uptake system ZnuABC Zn-binding protein ZnuA
MLNARPFRTACVILAAWLSASHAAGAALVRIGVSDHVYEDMAQQIGGRAVTVSLFQHRLFTLPALDIVICGCSGSDAWLADAAQPGTQVAVIKASTRSTVHRADMEFPWYDVQGMAHLTQTLAAELTRRAPAEAQSIASNAAGVDNLFNQLYYLPLGGADLVDYKAVSMMGSSAVYCNSVKGPGRSVNGRLTVSF